MAENFLSQTVPRSIHNITHHRHIHFELPFTFQRTRSRRKTNFVAKNLLSQTLPRSYQNINISFAIHLKQLSIIFSTDVSTFIRDPIPTGTLTQNLIPNPYNPNPTLSTNRLPYPNHQTPYTLGFVFLSPPPPGVILEPLSSQEFLFAWPTRRVRFTTVIRVSKFQFSHSETKNQHITH